MSRFDMKDSGERQEFQTGARRDTQDNKPRMGLLSVYALERVAWVYTLGARKYGDHNWQKGMPYSRYLDSAMRHLFSWIKGERDEDHLAQAVWNLMAILHHEEVGPEGLDDIHRLEKITEYETMSVDQSSDFVRVYHLNRDSLKNTASSEGVSNHHMAAAKDWPSGSVPQTAVRKFMELFGH